MSSSFSSMRVLLTGGAGFIGSHVLERFVELGAHVTVLDELNDFYDPAIKRRNLSEASRRGPFDHVEGDLRSEDVLDRVFQNGSFDVVVHLAAWAGVRPSIRRPLLYESVNVLGTLQILERLKATPATRFVFASSSSVYGNNSKVPFAEVDDIPRPVSPYAASKRSGELYTYTYHHLFGIPAACLRFFTVYGPRQRPEMAIHKFVRAVENGEVLELYGDGSTARDYTYVDDIVAGVLAAAERCEGYEIYNLGNAHPCTLRDLVAAIGEACGKEPQVVHRPMQPGDVEITFADVAKSRARLGFTAQVPLDEGLARFVSWYRQDR